MFGIGIKMSFGDVFAEYFLRIWCLGVYFFGVILFLRCDVFYAQCFDGFAHC